MTVWSYYVKRAASVGKEQANEGRVPFKLFFSLSSVL
jgi:hypothetical protein